MSVIVIYILCIGACLLVFLTGSFLNNSALQTFHSTEGAYAVEKIVGKDLIFSLSKNSHVINLKTVKLQAKKTNYYSFKYNVIKLAPVTFASFELSQLAISTHCFSQAKLAQNHTLFYLLKIISNFISKLISAFFIPVFLICAILNSKASTHTAYFILLFYLIAFSFCFIIELIGLIINLNSSKKVLNDLQATKPFSENELEILAKQLKAICKINFYDYSRYSIILLKLASPDMLFQINKNE